MSRLGLFRDLSVERPIIGGGDHQRLSVQILRPIDAMAHLATGIGHQPAELIDHRRGYNRQSRSRAGQKRGLAQGNLPAAHQQAGFVV